MRYYSKFPIPKHFLQDIVIVGVFSCCIPSTIIPHRALHNVPEDASPETRTGKASGFYYILNNKSKTVNIHLFSLP